MTVIVDEYYKGYSRKMSSSGKSAGKKQASHEYADGTIHTLVDQSGQPFEIRLKRSLGGDNGEGFSSACVFLAECVSRGQDSPPPRYDGAFVVKIFDPRYSTGLRQEFGVSDFDPDILEYIAESARRGDQAAFERDLTDPYSPPRGLSETTQEILSELLPSLRFGDIYGQALADDYVLQALLADGILATPPDDVERELFVWLMSQHMFRHEENMYRYLSQFPSAPVVRAKEIVKIQPKLPTHSLNDDKLAALSNAMGFGAILMEFVSGHTMSELRKLCLLSPEEFKEKPAEVRALVPTCRESARQFFEDVNNLLRFPLSVGIQSRDANLGNIMCSARPDGKGTQLIWIDAGQFQPVLDVDVRAPVTRYESLATFQTKIDEQQEQEIYGNLSFIFRKVGYSNSLVHDLKLERFRQWGRKVSMTFAWRAIMEDICFEDWEGGRPIDTQLSICIIRMAKSIMDQEKALAGVVTGIPPRAAPERQDFFHRAVLKLHYLLCAESADEPYVTPLRREAAARFDTLMASAGYPDGQVVVFGGSHAELMSRDGKCTYPSVEEVAQHLEATRIFPTRFWSADQPVDSVISELKERYEKVLKRRVIDPCGLYQ
ncbi:uncharacterized protein Z520_05241 [Fonsecaea multimorphosa CBS 102226]|uniref:Uncharacterized protein n=1 Tax=Fonsecaea multimorphosa CBS 102226 TaxID=1442371 RepID=A0A0D2HA74_9EURO|nr:uncharacterized protein Z520_05241 [Fonsecaea multimorphosa CBS 102226]KIX98780.1 hypothetical protein Z520_05241 [Fonsecaea multimorphosa CBS 102226]OAL25061.1 hypothetical protein AYO22_04938 [Fonsecaea multimorphosa]